MAIKSTIKRKVCSLYWMNDLYGGSETKVSQEGSVRGRGGRWHCVSSSYYEWVMSVSVSKQSLAGVYDSDVPWGHHPCSSWLLLIESISNGFWQNTLEEEPKNVTPGLKKKKKKIDYITIPMEFVFFFFLWPLRQTGVHCSGCAVHYSVCTCSCTWLNYNIDRL